MQEKKKKVNQFYFLSEKKNHIITFTVINQFFKNCMFWSLKHSLNVRTVK